MKKVYSKKFNINYIFKNHFDLVVIVFIPLIFMLIFFAIVNPISVDFKNKTDLLIENQKKYNDLKYSQSLKIKALEDQKKAMDVLDVAKLNLALPSQEDSENIMVIFEDIAKKSDVSLGSVFANNNPSGDTKIKRIEVVASVASSDPAKIKRFLENLENNERTIDVKSFSLIGGSISLNATMYYFIPTNVD